jgi:ATP-binding cassette subfamily B protein
MTAPDDETLGRVYDARLARRLLRYVRPYRRLVVGAVLLLCIEGGVQLVGPALTRQVIDVAIPAGDAGMVRTAALLYALSLLLQFTAGYGETVLTGTARPARDARSAHAAVRPPAAAADRFYDRSPVGRLVTRVTSMSRR